MIDPLTGQDVTGYVDPSTVTGGSSSGFSFTNFLNQVGTGVTGWATQALNQQLGANQTANKTTTAPASSTLSSVASSTGLSTGNIIVIGVALVVLIVVVLMRKGGK